MTGSIFCFLLEEAFFLVGVVRSVCCLLLDDVVFMISSFCSCGDDRLPSSLLLLSPAVVKVDGAGNWGVSCFSTYDRMNSFAGVSSDVLESDFFSCTLNRLKRHHFILYLSYFIDLFSFH